MKILIVAATSIEIQYLLKKRSGRIPVGRITEIASHKRNKIFLLVTGPGMVATAYHLGRISSHAFDVAMNTGICGSFSKRLYLGRVVNVISDCFSEHGAETGERFLSLSSIGIKRIFFPFGKNIIMSGTLKNLPPVSGITVNTVHGNSDSIKKVVRRFHPDIETMEGAAFFYACSQQKIPCLQIRAVSNYVAMRNKSAWNIPLAVKNLNETVIKILDEIQTIVHRQTNLKLS